MIKYKKMTDKRLEGLHTLSHPKGSNFDKELQKIVKKTVENAEDHRGLLYPTWSEIAG